jgi:hypothetical protein
MRRQQTPLAAGVGGALYPLLLRDLVLGMLALLAVARRSRLLQRARV